MENMATECGHHIIKPTVHLEWVAKKGPAQRLLQIVVLSLNPAKGEGH